MILEQRRGLFAVAMPAQTGTFRCLKLLTLLYVGES